MLGGGAGELADRRRSKPLEGDAPSVPTSPARQRGFFSRMGAGLRPAKIGRHGGHPSSFITNAARERPSKTLGGRCSVGAHFSRAPARPCQPDGRGAAPRENRTTQPPARRSYASERGHPSKFTAFPSSFILHPSSFILSPELRRLSFPSRGSYGLVVGFKGDFIG